MCYFSSGHIEMASIPAGAWSINITNLLQPQQATLSMWTQNMICVRVLMLNVVENY